ncbi:hypothetical protein FQN54_009323 [Arachnomyces sp. PD_36]|nr:hypothetical protein FQN54_009323 [Arachnomyces sp. PD_36]
MVLLTITPNILNTLETLSPSSRKELSLPSDVAPGAPISHTQLIALSRHFSKQHGELHTRCDQDTPGGTDDGSMTSDNGAATSNECSLDSLLRGTNIYKPPPPAKPEPSAEYLALKSRLQAAAEANAYNNLLQPGPISGAPHHAPLISSSPSYPRLATPNINNQNDLEDEDPLTPSLVLNILISILMTGFATYWAVSHFRLPGFLLFVFSSPSSGLAVSSRLAHESYPGSRSSGPIRVFISLATAVVVGVAEVVIYAAYLRKVKMAREKERKIVERKEVRFVVDKEVEREAEGVDVGEKEEIWGRGVNGGVRRRVREKWEEKGK